MRVAAGRLHLREGLGPAPARLVHHLDGLPHQLLPGDDALDDARHLVRAAASAPRNDQADRLARLPSGRAQRGIRQASERGGSEREQRARTKAGPTHGLTFLVDMSSEYIIQKAKCRYL